MTAAFFANATFFQAAKRGLNGGNQLRFDRNQPVFKPVIQAECPPKITGVSVCSQSKFEVIGSRDRIFFGIKF